MDGYQSYAVTGNYQKYDFIAISFVIVRDMIFTGNYQSNGFTGNYQSDGRAGVIISQR